METKEVGTQEEVVVRTIEDYTIASVNFKQFGNSRQVKNKEEVIKASTDNTLNQLTKKLLDGEEIDRINKHTAKVRNYLQGMSLPMSFKAGFYLVPRTRLYEVDEYLKQAKSQFDTLVQEAGDAYPRIMRDTLIRLNAFGNQGDYPSKEQFINCFAMKWYYLSCSPDGNIDGELRARENEKWSALQQEIVEESRLLLRQQILDLVTNLTNRLSALNKREEGKIVRFYDSAINNVVDWTELFKDMNIGNDEKLLQVSEQLKNLLKGVNIENIKELSGYRAKIAGKMEETKELLVEMVKEEKRTRTFAFGK